MVGDVWPENADAWDAWCHLDNSWRRNVMTGAYEGLIKGDAQAVLEMMGYRKRRRRAVFGQLMEMERAALAAFSDATLQ